MNSVPQLLTLAEAAKALAVPEATLRDWRVDRKNLNFVKIGGNLRVDVREIERYIAAHTEGPTVAKTVAMERRGTAWKGADEIAEEADFTA